MAVAEEDIKNSFERCCRLCAEEQEATIMIFSEEAKAMLLHNKLNKYLLIEVEQHDKLPKNICVSCCTKLQSVCDFIDSARKAQEVLMNRNSMVEQFVSEQKFMVKSEPKSDHEDADISDDENKCTEMEVSVDPMMVLQNCERPLSPTNLLENESNAAFITEDVTHMHSVDQDNVTIKLIRKDFNLDLTLKQFVCVSNGCGKSFASELSLKNHSWIHCESQDEKRYKCNSCKAGFDIKSKLIAHIREHKLSGLCRICGRWSERNLSVHMAAHLSKGKSYICKICGRSYNTRSNLKTHSITHSNERPYECHICKKSFKRNQDLKFHINQHTGAKPYKCPFCDKSFASSGNCYSHRNRMHPGKCVDSKMRRLSRENQPLLYRPIAPKPNKPNNQPSFKGIIKYQCTMCDHSFMKRDNFTYHMYQHTGEKPFHCSLCPETFVTRRGLLIHHNKEHPSKDRPLALISKNVLLK
ncbi:zinc finger protein 135 isoform X2 [Amyelois transitella]|uniref:zinc finger protein 135 isoform X2 n=1 Tax=Amyelois transitella TaxID=680683 RepID=UPI00298F9AF9|nr:zinc finger protein 135 isoform X2 [Amyelois transitella]